MVFSSTATGATICVRVTPDPEAMLAGRAVTPHRLSAGLAVDEVETTVVGCRLEAVDIPPALLGAIEAVRRLEAAELPAALGTIDVGRRLEAVEFPAALVAIVVGRLLEAVELPALLGATVVARRAGAFELPAPPLARLRGGLLLALLPTLLTGGPRRPGKLERTEGRETLEPPALLLEA